MEKEEKALICPIEIAMEHINRDAAKRLLQAEGGK